MSRILAALLLASIADGALVEQATAEGVAEFYKGKAITSASDRHTALSHVTSPTPP